MVNIHRVAFRPTIWWLAARGGLFKILQAKVQKYFGLAAIFSRYLTEKGCACVLFVVYLGCIDFFCNFALKFQTLI